MMHRLHEGKHSTEEIQCVKADGSIFWGRISATPVELEGEVCGRVMIRDVTRQRSLKKRLEEERDLFSRVLETSPVAITIVDQEGKITFANRQTEEVLGVEREEITNRTYDDPLWKLADVSGDEDVHDELPFVQVMNTGEPVYGVEHSIEGADGERRILSVNGAPFFEEEGRVKSVVFAIEDITDRRAVRRALVESQQRLQALFDNALDLLLLADDSGDYVDVNPVAEHVLGYSRQEFRDMNFWDLTPQATREEGQRVWEEFLAEGQMEGEYEDMTRDGRRLQMEFRAVADIQPGLHLSVMRDVTDRKRLEEQTDRFFSLSLDLLCIADTEGYFRRINPAFQEVFGYSREELLGRPFIDFVHPDDRAETEQVLCRLSEGQEVTKFVNRYQCKDGTCRWIEWDATPDPEGELVYAVARDITRRHEYEENLRRAKERAEEMNRLKSSFLANMSHEIRTPLTSIIGYADLLKNRLPEGEHSHVEHISQSGKRLLSTLNSVLDLAQLESGEMKVTPRSLNVVEEIQRIGDSLRVQVDTNIVDLRFDLPPNPAWAQVDKGIFGRIVTNLIHNAVKFTHEGYVEVRCRLSEEIITVDVEDTGIGMEEESSGLSRQFEGSGLGLTITRHLLELVGGRIDVESHKGEGSTFTVEIPRDWRDTAEQGGGFAAPDPVVQEPLPAGQHILVVDDDPAAAELITEMLPDTHAVDAAAAPDEALSLTAGQEYDLIFMDINLKARINGAELLEEMRGADVVGGATVVALTAYALPGDREKYLAKGFDGYLAKPFNRMILFDHLARLLD